MSDRMSKAEFIALIAMMFATIAFSLDAMLPALPEIAQELSPGDVNRAQLILTSFVLGMGAGTLVVGPISDAFGRKNVIVFGSVIYIAGAALAWVSQSLEVVLMARVLQGLGAAAPRVVALAIIRDLYQGRDMARIMSIAMMIFTIFPAFAPLLGAGIIAMVGWRGIFLAFILFSLIVLVWMGLRLPETLPRESRRPIRPALLAAAAAEIARHPTVRLSIMVQTLAMGILFTMLTMVQPVYDVIFDKAESFPFIFGAVALVSGTSSLLNAKLVIRLGMRRIVSWSLASQIVLSALMLALEALPLSEPVHFACFVVWQTSVFFIAGTTMGNLNAMAMEPMGHIAGTAASVIGAVATVGAILIAAPVGLLFNGSLLPLGFGILIMSCIGYGLMRHMARVEDRLPV
ncbi:multidrug effflux MFS transporter [Falsiphaeobacter marinintestinus]|uniref:multidrug effflux MFS transporter n=1 Tax=Falsiphaeobacter marinintestinus TaxID=1492905 RepID=UPI0011B5AEA1|nr:multidrug effflux MFS transporter [Phaeobacter marinintestinus]